MSNPPFPPSVPAGSHEMREYYPNQDPPRPSPHTAPSITPYLGLRARLSQIWINRWTILLLLVLARTLIQIASINEDLATARREALSACSEVESVGSAMASMPHYMSQGANELAAQGVEKAVSGLMDMLMLSVTGVEEIVVFYLDMITSTYGCLITMAVTGTIGGTIDAVEQSQGFLNSSIKTIGGDVSNAVSTFLTEYNSATSQVNSIVGLSGSKINFPTLDLSSELKTLSNLKLPSDLDPILNNIKAHLPTFKQVQNDTNNAIRTPFEFAKSEIQNNLGNFTFDRSVFPVPGKEQLTFCSDNNGINDFFDELVHVVATAKPIFIAVLLVAATLVCIPMGWREIRRWRIMQERAKLVQANAHDPMDVVYIVSRPFTSTAGIKLASRFKKTRSQLLVRWAFAYVTTDAAIFVLSLSLAAFFSVGCQFVLLKSLQREVPVLTNEVGAFADKIVARLENASTSWAVGTNTAISSVSDDINSQMLGWVNVTTGAINSTLNLFVDETITILNQTFGGTILYTPILDVLNCLVLMKAAGVEKGLAWVSDNAHVTIPNFPTNMFSLGAVASIASNNSNPSDSFLSAPGDQASDEISAAVDRFIGKIEYRIHTEAYLAFAILCFWLAIVLIAVIRALTLCCTRDKTRGEGGGPPPAPVNDDYGNGSVMQENIPMGAVYVVQNVRPSTPAPKYSTAVSERDVKNPFNSPEEEYDESKLGFAGHRDYDNTVSRNPTGNGKGRITSVHPEVYDDYKG